MKSRNWNAVVIHAFEEAARVAGAVLPALDHAALLAQSLALKRSGRTILHRIAIQPAGKE